MKLNPNLAYNMSELSNFSEVLNVARDVADAAAAVHREHSGSIDPEEAFTKGLSLIHI